MERVTRLSIFILLYDSIAYAIAIAILDTNTVIPYFLREIGTVWLVPWAEALKQLSIFLPQMFLYSRVPRTANNVQLITRVMFFDRPQLLIIPFLILLGLKGSLLGGLFFLSLFIFFFGEGAILLFWMDLLGGLTDARNRGKFFGYSQLLGGIGAACAAVLIGKALNSGVSVYIKYEVIFTLSALVLLPSLILFPRIKQPKKDVTATSAESVSLKLLLGNKALKRLIIIQFLIGLGWLAFPFYLLDLLDLYPALESSVGTLAASSIGGTLLGGILWGGISVFKGNKLAIQGVVVASIIVPLLFLIYGYYGVETPGVIVLQSGFVLLGALMGGWLGFVNYIMEISDDRERAGNLFIYNTTMVLSSVYPLLGGLLRNWLDMKIILILIIIGMIGAVILTIKMPEPRKETSTLI